MNIQPQQEEKPRQGKVDPRIDVAINGHISRRVSNHIEVLWLSGDYTYDTMPQNYKGRVSRVVLNDVMGNLHDFLAVDGGIIC